MKDIKAIIDELADLRDIDIQSLDALGKCKTQYTTQNALIIIRLLHNVYLILSRTTTRLVE